MITKTISARGSKGHHDFTLTVQEDTTSSNSSFISYTFKISATNSSWQWRGYPSITYTITINGTNYTGTIASFNGSTTTLKTGSNIEIPHNNDGTKTINISFSVTDPNTSVSYTCGNASANSTMELTTLHTIPLITNINVTENTISGITNTQIARYLSNKTYTITAQAYDSATISKYRVYNGNQLVGESNTNQVTVDYSSVELQTYTYNNVLYAIVGFEVEDSLGATRLFVYETYFPIIEYNLPNIITTSSNIKRNGQSTGQVNLNLKATYTSGTIGSTTNDVTLEFAYWVKGQSESSTYYTIPSNAISIVGNDITISNWTMYKSGTLIEDVNPNYAYYFKIKITDAFSKANVVQLLCASGEYIMCKFKDRVDFKKITEQGNDVQLKGKSIFHDVNGENGNVTLNELPYSYSAMEIYATDQSGRKNLYHKLLNPTENDELDLSTVGAGTTNTFIRRTRYTLVGNSMVVSNAGVSRITSNSADTTIGTNEIYITDVIVYK